MNITQFIEYSVFRKNGFLTALVMGPLLFGYLLLYPNLILHFTEFTKYYIKYPVIASIFVLAFILGARTITNFWPMVLVLLLLISNYMLVQSIPSSQYPVQAILLLLLAGMFYRHPNLIGLYFKIAIFISMIFGVQTIIVFFFWLGTALGVGAPLPVESVIFQGEAQGRPINIFLGSDGWLNVRWWAGFRATSYFSEATRFSIFLTPFLYAASYLRRRSFYYDLAFYLIAITIFLTFSVAAFTSIAFTYFLYRYDTLSEKVKFILKLLFVLVPVMFLSYVAYPDFWNIIFDKSGSLETRVEGITHVLEVIGQHQTGCDMVEPVCETLHAKISWAPLFWLAFAGVQGFGFAMLMVMYYVICLFRMVNGGEGLERTLAYGGIAALLEQSWYGDYFEFPFIAFFAILMALAAMRRKLKKEYSVAQ